MALAAGTVTVTAHATTGAPVYVGSGLSLALAQGYLDGLIADGVLPALPALGSTSAPFSADRPAEQADIDAAIAARGTLYATEARRARLYAAALVTHITANAKARVTSESLGRTPDPNNANTAIQAPAAPVEIPIV